MATKPTKSSKRATTYRADEKIGKQDMLKFSKRNYIVYGMAVNEDRAVADFRDGLQPVHRRLAYATKQMADSSSKQVKAGRIVGDVLGKYHPHGDSSIYGAMVTMANRRSIVPLIRGHGNWGSMSGWGAAHYRYTEAKLSKFSDQCLFDSRYKPLVEMVPNFDGSMTEPLLLPALLPVILLNGREGIGVGATASVPAVTKESLLKALKAIYEGEEITPKFLYRKLRFTTLLGGEEVLPTEDEDKRLRLAIFKTPKGRTRFRSLHTWDEKSRTLAYTKFADVPKMETLLEKLLDIEGVEQARDDSVKTDKYGTVTIILKKNITPKLQAAIRKHIDEKVMASRSSYVINVTERYINELGQGAAKMRSTSLMQLLIDWVQWRTDLEQRMCAYWIEQATKDIAHIELMMKAIDCLEIIIKALRQKLDRPGLDAYLAKHMKITLEEAHVISEMRVYQLRALEKNELIEKRKVVQAKRLGLKAHHKEPLPHMAQQLATFKFEA